MLRLWLGSFGFMMMFRVVLLVLSVAALNCSSVHEPKSIISNWLIKATSKQDEARRLNRTVTSCPEPGLIYPCSCLYTSENTARVHCHDIRIVDDLQRVLSHLSRFRLSTLTLSDSSMDHLPGHILLPMEINVLHLSRVNCSKVSFFEADGSQTLSGNKLTRSLYSIELEKAEGIDRWDWSAFKGFEILDQVRIVDSSLPRLTKSFGKLPSSTETISFEKVDMRTIAHGALVSLHNLKTLRINRTPLKMFERNVLARPSLLQVLDLANNHLNALDTQMFVDMPFLSIVSLKGNQLVTLSSSVFNVLSSYSHLKLYISDNPFNCVCDLAWLSKLYSKKQNIFGNELDLFCATPFQLRGERLHLLEEADFQCPKSLTETTKDPHRLNP